MIDLFTWLALFVVWIFLVIIGTVLSAPVLALFILLLTYAYQKALAGVRIVIQWIDKFADL